MAISIDDLKSGLYRGLAKPNLFEIEFHLVKYCMIQKQEKPEKQ